jgi:lysophospholipase L1-like esterase
MKKKLIIIISVSINILMVGAFAIKRLYFNQRPIASAPSEWSVSWNKQKKDLYSAVPIDSGDIVFVGDSHIERFLLNDFYPEMKIRNRGIGSNTTDQVINRMPDILRAKPSKLFLLIGINDLTMGKRADSVYGNITKIATMTKKAGTAVSVISLLPCRGAEADLNGDVIKLNEGLSRFCQKEQIDYIDVFSQVVKDGTLNKELTFDGTHLNSNGYLIFKKKIDNYLN